MEIVFLVCIVTVGLVFVTYFVTQKNVKKHITEINFGRILEFKTETEFSKED